MHAQQEHNLYPATATSLIVVLMLGTMIGNPWFMLTFAVSALMAWTFFFRHAVDEQSLWSLALGAAVSIVLALAITKL